ncbi:MAG TPA: HEAT repeat domain-containing protein [Planctomycetota bacterium]|nr:HEAT repeat domain-containing protein [Planctomycetota bacterium]
MRSHFWPALLLLAACGGPEPNLRSQDPYERFLGERELVERTDAASMAEIVGFLEDPHFLVIVGAIELLAHRNRPEFLQHFAPKLKHPHPLVRQAACAAIAAIHNPEGVPPLIETLKDPDPAVRRDAVKALAKFPEVPESQAALVDAVADKDISVSYMAHRLLGEKTGKTNVERKREAWIEALK